MTRTTKAKTEKATRAPGAEIGDAELLARVAEFYPALEKHNVAMEASSARRAEAETVEATIVR